MFTSKFLIRATFAHLLARDPRLRPVRFGAGQQADRMGRRLRGRRRLRHRRAHRRRGDGADAEAAHHRQQQARRRDQHRRRLRRQGRRTDGTRHADRRLRDAGRQPVAVRQAALQRREGLRAGRDAGALSAAAGGARRTCRRRTSRSSSPGPRPASGGINYASAGCRQPAPPRDRAVRASAPGCSSSHVPYRGAAPAVQDLLGGQVPFVLHRHRQRAAVHRVGQAARDRRRQRRSALPTMPDGADARRAGPDRLRGLRLAGPGRAGGRAARDGGAPQQGARRGA